MARKRTNAAEEQLGDAHEPENPQAVPPETLEFPPREGSNPPANSRSPADQGETPPKTWLKRHNDRTLAAIGVKTHENFERRRLEVEFSANPGEEICSLMKQNGYRWGGKQDPVWSLKIDRTDPGMTREVHNRVVKEIERLMAKQEGQSR